jgi:hypothetical protein
LEGLTLSKFKVSQLAFAVCLGLIVTSGSVASWSLTNESSQGLLPSSEPNSSQTSISSTSDSSQSNSEELASENEEQSPFLAAAETSTPESRLSNLVIDPDAAGSPDVVYPEPSEREQAVATKAPAPTNFRVTSLGDDFVSLAFSTSPSVSLYQVYIRHNDSFTLKGVGSSGVVTFRDLGADFDYVACVYYQVNGVDSNLACLNIHTTGTRPIEPVKAPAPTNIQLSATETTVSASWDAVAGAKWYRLCHVSGDSSWQCGGYTNLGPTSAIFQDGSISKATRYGITVEAVMADGNSGERAIRYITTPGTLPPPPTKYAAPTNLRITAISTSEFTAAWDYPTDSPITYWSFAVRQLTSYSYMATNGSARTFTFRDLQPANGYEIILKGMDDNGLWTEEVRLGFYSPAN